MEQQIGRYQILDEIASGGQGAVYRVFDPDTGQIVALKVLHASLSTDSNYVERFRREASLASSIDHPNVVKIFDVGEVGDQHFMALEFLPESLARIIEAGGQMRLDRVAEFGIQIADGLAQAHVLGIVHRDIKPQNILIGADGLAKVTDFGIARSEVLSTMTATGAVMGTPHYMSPEQSRGEEADARSYIYSLGCMLYQMVTGELPFKGNTPLAVIRQQIDDEPTPMRELRGDLTPALESLVERAMAKDPDSRFQSVSDLSAALRDALPEVEAAPREGGRPRVGPTIAPPVTPTQPTKRPSATWMESWAGAWQRTHRTLGTGGDRAVPAAHAGCWHRTVGRVGRGERVHRRLKPSDASGGPAPIHPTRRARRGAGSPRRRADGRTNCARRDLGGSTHRGGIGASSGGPGRHQRARRGGRSRGRADQTRIVPGTGHGRHRGRGGAAMTLPLHTSP